MLQAANVMRNDLKLVFRLGRFPDWRRPSYELLRSQGKSPASILDSASRTNPRWNAVGVETTISTTINAVVANATPGGEGC
jgi:hypothetical protein